MDYKDLQINDWVYLSEAAKYAMQVASIDKYECSLDFEGNAGDPFLAIYGEGGIAPIPLTEEMLAEHNFNPNYIDWWKPEEEKNCFHISAFREYAAIRIEAAYVHEFQHALRLVGYNDLADNFKIK